MRFSPTLWWLMPLLALVQAGTYGSFESGSDLPEDQVQEVLALYRRHCKSNTGYGGYGGAPGTSVSNIGNNINIVCKEGKEHFEPPKKKVIRIPAQKPKKNILFVEAPKYKIKHHINVIPQAVKPPKTVIYVLEPKAQHKLKVWDKRYGKPGLSKPQVYFLKGDKHSSTPQTPPPVYGVPPPTYGVPEAPSQGYSYFQSAASEQVSHNLPFDPSTLGPEYEIVPADPDTQSKFQKLYQEKHNPTGDVAEDQQALLPEIRLESQLIEPDANSDRPAIITDRLILPQEDISSQLYSKFDEPRGKLFFPDELIPERNSEADIDLRSKSFPANGDEVHADDAASIRNLLSKLSEKESRSKEVTTTSSAAALTSTASPVTTVTNGYNIAPRRLNLFDRNYVQRLIQTARNAGSSKREAIAEAEIFSDLPDEGQFDASANSKRSVGAAQPSFEIIPAQFISYSYSKE